MHRLFALVAVIASGVLVSGGIAHAGTPPAPVPEPSSIALLGVGAAALALWHRGRKK